MKSLINTWRIAVRQAGRNVLPSTTKHILLNLSLYMNAEGTCFPTIDRQAADTCLSRRVVIAHIRKAVAAGFLKKRIKGRNGQGWALHEYAALLPGAPAEEHPPADGDAPTPPLSQGGNPDGAKAVTEGHPNYPKELKEEEPTSAGEFAYDGYVIRLNTKDWESRKKLYGLSDDQLGDWMDRRDDWLKTLQKSDRRVVNWWTSTWKALDADVEGIKASDRYRQQLASG